MSSTGSDIPGTKRTVRLVTLGCARNDVDSEELAGRLEAGGWDLTDGEEADVVLVNTCGFIQAAKQESIDELLAAADSGAAVVAAGCLAERYGKGLGDALPEAHVLGFDDYHQIAARLDDVLAGRRWAAHEPRDRRQLLPITPAERGSAAGPAIPGHGSVGDGSVGDGSVGHGAVGHGAVGHGAVGHGAVGHGAVGGANGRAPAGRAAGIAARFEDLPDGIAPASGPRVVRRRLGGGAVAPLKIASGCDRRCSFCAIPAFRGAFLSRPPQDLLTEAAWLADHGVRELFLVSENSTSYGKDLGDLRLLESVLPALAAVPGIDRVRVSYLQPAEVRPGLIEVMTSTPGVVPYFDLSFQHASGAVLRSMRRFGDAERFLALIEQIRKLSPEAGIRSNFIVGFPGETRDDLAVLEDFLAEAGLDAIGVFGYSDEEGTEAATLPGHLPEDEVAERVEAVAALADELMAQRAADRIGEIRTVLIEEVLDEAALRYGGRAEHQAPEVDGATEVVASRPLAVGDLVRARVSGSEGVDLVADLIDVPGCDRPEAPGAID